MPNTADHRADMHRIATERRAAGMPVWDRKVRLADVFHNPEMTFVQRRDAIVARLRGSAWLKNCDAADTLPYLVDELADAQDADEFDAVWDLIYDNADADRVWIATR